MAHGAAVGAVGADGATLAAGGTERFAVVVVGGGQAGLAVGYHLARRGLRFVILDAGERTGNSWRKRWGLAPRVHPGPPRWAARHAVPRAGRVVPHEGRGGRLPGGLRGALRPAGAHGRHGGRARPGRRPVRRDGRRPPVRGRQRGAGPGRVPAPPGPGLRPRARSGDRAAALQRVPEAFPAAGGRRPRRGRRQLGGRDRLGGVPRAPDLAVGAGHRGTSRSAPGAGPSGWSFP